MSDSSLAPLAIAELSNELERATAETSAAAVRAKYSRKMTQALADEMRSRRTAGAHIAELARDYGLCTCHAYRILRGQCFTGKPYMPPSKHSAETVRRVRELLAAGEKHEWIALECGVGVSTVSCYATGRRRRNA